MQEPATTMNVIEAHFENIADPKFFYPTVDAKIHIAHMLWKHCKDIEFDFDFNDAKPNYTKPFKNWLMNELSNTNRKEFPNNVSSLFEWKCLIGIVILTINMRRDLGALRYKEIHSLLSDFYKQTTTGSLKRRRLEDDVLELTLTVDSLRNDHENLLKRFEFMKQQLTSFFDMIKKPKV